MTPPGPPREPGTALAMEEPGKALAFLSHPHPHSPPAFPGVSSHEWGPFCRGHPHSRSQAHSFMHSPAHAKAGPSTPQGPHAHRSSPRSAPQARPAGTFPWASPSHQLSPAGALPDSALNPCGQRTTPPTPPTPHTPQCPTPPFTTLSHPDSSFTPAHAAAASRFPPRTNPPQCMPPQMSLPQSRPPPTTLTPLAPPDLLELQQAFSAAQTAILSLRQMAHPGPTTPWEPQAHTSNQAQAQAQGQGPGQALAEAQGLGSLPRGNGAAPQQSVPAQGSAHQGAGTWRLGQLGRGEDGCARGLTQQSHAVVPPDARSLCGSPIALSHVASAHAAQSVCSSNSGESEVRLRCTRDKGDLASKNLAETLKLEECRHHQEWTKGNEGSHQQQQQLQQEHDSGEGETQGHNVGQNSPQRNGEEAPVGQDLLGLWNQRDGAGSASGSGPTSGAPTRETQHDEPRLEHEVGRAEERGNDTMGDDSMGWLAAKDGAVDDAPGLQGALPGNTATPPRPPPPASRPESLMDLPDFDALFLAPLEAHSGPDPAAARAHECNRGNPAAGKQCAMRSTPAGGEFASGALEASHQPGLRIDMNLSLASNPAGVEVGAAHKSEQQSKQEHRPPPAFPSAATGPAAIPVKNWLQMLPYSKNTGGGEERHDIAPQGAASVRAAATGLNAEARNVHSHPETGRPRKTRRTVPMSTDRECTVCPWGSRGKPGSRAHSQEQSACTPKAAVPCCCAVHAEKQEGERPLGHCCGGFSHSHPEQHCAAACCNHCSARAGYRVPHGEGPRCSAGCHAGASRACSGAHSDRQPEKPSSHGGTCSPGAHCHHQPLHSGGSGSSYADAGCRGSLMKRMEEKHGSQPASGAHMSCMGNPQHPDSSPSLHMSQFLPVFDQTMPEPSRGSMTDGYTGGVELSASGSRDGYPPVYRLSKTGNGERHAAAPGAISLGAPPGQPLQRGPLGAVQSPKCGQGGAFGTYTGPISGTLCPHLHGPSYSHSHVHNHSHSQRHAHWRRSSSGHCPDWGNVTPRHEPRHSCPPQQPNSGPGASAPSHKPTELQHPPKPPEGAHTPEHPSLPTLPPSQLAHSVHGPPGLAFPTHPAAPQPVAHGPRHSATEHLPGHPACPFTGAPHPGYQSPTLPSHRPLTPYSQSPAHSGPLSRACTHHPQPSPSSPRTQPPPHGSSPGVPPDGPRRSSAAQSLPHCAHGEAQRPSALPLGYAPTYQQPPHVISGRRAQFPDLSAAEGTRRPAQAAPQQPGRPLRGPAPDEDNSTAEAPLPRITNRSPRPPTARPDPASAKGVPGAPSCWFVGVRLRKYGTWASEIREPGRERRIWLGSFDSPEKAAFAHDMAARLLQGLGAKLNFPFVLQLAPVGSSCAAALIKAAEAQASHNSAVIPDEDVRPVIMDHLSRLASGQSELSGTIIEVKAARVEMPSDNLAVEPENGVPSQNSQLTVPGREPRKPPSVSFSVQLEQAGSTSRAQEGRPLRDAQQSAWPASPAAAAAPTGISGNSTTVVTQPAELAGYSRGGATQGESAVSNRTTLSGSRKRKSSTPRMVSGKSREVDAGDSPRGAEDMYEDPGQSPKGIYEVSA